MVASLIIQDPAPEGIILVLEQHRVYMVSCAKKQGHHSLGVALVLNYELPRDWLPTDDMKLALMDCEAPDMPQVAMAATSSLFRVIPNCPIPIRESSLVR